MLVLRQTLRAVLGAVALAACAAALPSTNEAHAAGSPYLEVVDPAEAMRSPAYRYANMSNEEAFAELDRRHILYTKQRATLGVRAPIRLTGRLHGVHVHSSLPPEARPSTPFEILDARLALSLDDFCAILARHDIDEVIHYTMYRPNVSQPSGGPPGWMANVEAPAEVGRTAEPSTKIVAPPAGPAKSGSKATSRSAKKRAPAKTLAKGERAPKGASLPPQKRSTDRRKDAYGVELDDASFDEVVGDKLDVVDSSPGDHERSKAAPKHGKPSAGGKAQGSGTAKASGGSKSPAPRPTAIGSTSRRTAGALRRPPSKAADAGEAEHTHGKWAPPGTRHPAGLAIDLGAVHKRGGRWLSIASHFDGKIGQKTCGAGAPVPEGSDAKELHAIVCEAREAGVFTYALTPNFNQEHVDHVHFEIKPGVTWFLYH